MFEIEWEDDGELDEFIDKVKDEVEMEIYDLADRIDATSQILVSQRAHDTGTLKKSHSVIMQGNMIALIGYNTSYALPVHDGFDDMDVSVPQHTRREHTRRTKHGVVSVKSHDVREHQRHMRARPPTNYLDDAVKIELEKLDPEVREMISISRYRSDLLGET